MGVVLGLGLCAAVVLRFFRWLKTQDDGGATMTSIKTQAATVASLAGAVFDVISAATTARVAVSHVLTSAAATPRPALPAGSLRFGSIGHSPGPGGIPVTG